MRGLSNFLHYLNDSLYLQYLFCSLCSDVWSLAFQWLLYITICIWKRSYILDKIHIFTPELSGSVQLLVFSLSVIRFEWRIEMLCTLACWLSGPSSMVIRVLYLACTICKTLGLVGNIWTLWFCAWMSFLYNRFAIITHAIVPWLCCRQSQ